MRLGHLWLGQVRLKRRRERESPAETGHNPSRGHCTERHSFFFSLTLRASLPATFWLPPGRFTVSLSLSRTWGRGVIFPRTLPWSITLALNPTVKFNSTVDHGWESTLTRTLSPPPPGTWNSYLGQARTPWTGRERRFHLTDERRGCVCGGHQELQSTEQERVRTRLPSVENDYYQGRRLT